MRTVVDQATPLVLETVAEAVGCDPFEHLEEGTRYLQPAVFCASVAAWMQRDGDARDVLAFAGHSLGELGALVAAGSLALEDGARLVALRGKLTARHDADLRMMAVGRLPQREVEDLAMQHGLTVACFNSPTQLVLAGNAARLRSARDRVRAAGGRAVLLDIGGAFHSPELDSSAKAFRDALEQVTFRPPSRPVLSCLNGQPFTDPRRQLAASLVSPVQWISVMATLEELGATRYEQMPPGHHLAKLAIASAAGTRSFAYEGGERTEIRASRRKAAQE